MNKKSMMDKMMGMLPGNAMRRRMMHGGEVHTDETLGGDSKMKKKAKKRGMQRGGGAMKDKPMAMKRGGAGKKKKSKKRGQHERS